MLYIKKVERSLNRSFWDWWESFIKDWMTSSSKLPLYHSRFRKKKEGEENGYGRLRSLLSWCSVGLLDGQPWGYTSISILPLRSSGWTHCRFAYYNRERSPFLFSPLPVFPRPFQLERGLTFTRGLPRPRGSFSPFLCPNTKFPDGRVGLSLSQSN